MKRWKILTQRRSGWSVRFVVGRPGFIPFVESYQKTLKNDIHSFPAWRSAFRGGYGGEAGKFAFCIFEQGT